MINNRYLVFFLLVWINSFSKIFAQELPKKIYTTQRISGDAPLIDGLLIEPAWDQVPWGGDFTQRMPSEGLEPTQKTSFKILYDEKNLYIAIRCHDNEPDKIVRRMSRRDGFEGDWVEINIDSYFDHLTASSFTVSASGVIGDEAISNNGQDWDSSWDPVWYVKTNVDAEGWTAEYRIPLSQLRFPNKEEQIWGLQISRKDFRKDEISVWQFISRNAPGWVHLFGELHGLKGIKPQKQLEVQPYVVARTETKGKDENNPFNNTEQNNISFGADGKIGLTSNITLDFTINPDFGQVEADPSIVNLTGFQNYFNERRPFFIEGKNILDYTVSPSIAWGDHNSDNLFYSRRIGRRPQYEPDNDYINSPENTTILGALKLTGKTRKGLSIGIMESVTDKETADVMLNGEKYKKTVEPLTNYFVARVLQDFNKGNTQIGGILTSVNRKMDDPNIKNELNEAAYTGGLDFIHNWKNRTYYVSGNVVFSSIQGTKSSITNIQKRHEHYFQRPDAGHLKVDSTFTSLSGYGGTFKIGRGGNGNIRFQGGITVRSPGAEFNDIGFMRNADLINQFFWAGYQLRNPYKFLRRFSFNVNQWKYLDFSGKGVYDAANFNTYAQFNNYWSINGGITNQWRRISNYDLRGGPSIKYPGGAWYFYNIQSDYRKKFNFGFGHEFFDGRDNYNFQQYFNLWINWQPLNSLSFSLSPGMSFNRDEIQYVETVEVEKKQKYIVSKIDQKTANMSFRVNLNITPTLTVQYYAQPFVSNGQYSHFKYITDPHAKELNSRYQIYTKEISFDTKEDIYLVDEDIDGSTDFSFENPDFNIVEFQSNFVIRWEYKPGSTIFLVWSENRSNDPKFVRPSFGDLTREMWQIAPHDIFLIKLSYRFIN